MRIHLVQFGVSHNVAANKHTILSALQVAQPNDWLVFPECALTGYFPEEDGFLEEIDPAVVDHAVNDIEQEVHRQYCHCLFGTATFAGGAWYNAVMVQSYTRTSQVYRKIRLSRLDKRHFLPGHTLPVYHVGGVKIGIQVCREVVFPEPWRSLKRSGAQVIFHINNAIKPYDEKWEHILITRAIENRLFVCSVNNAATPQTLTSYLIAPSGQTLLKADQQADQTAVQTIDLSEVHDLEDEPVVH